MSDQRGSKSKKEKGGKIEVCEQDSHDDELRSAYGKPKVVKRFSIK